MSESSKLWTIGAILNWTEQFFANKGVDTPRLDAEVLLSHMLGKERIYCYSHYDEPLEKDELARYKQLILARIEGKSVAVLVGKKEFMGLDFVVNEHVLIPRADTETVVDAVFSLIDREKAIRILDMCTGSGAILLSLLNYMQSSVGLGVDLSERALEVATLNRDRLGLTDRATFIQSNMFERIYTEEKFDILISNPPYIPSKDIAMLSKEVVAEPHMALDGGIDGLDFYRLLLQEAPSFIKEGGYVGFEVGYDQAEAVQKLANAYHIYGEMLGFKDLAGYTRAVFFKVGNHGHKNL